MRRRNGALRVLLRGAVAAALLMGGGAALAGGEEPGHAPAGRAGKAIPSDAFVAWARRNAIALDPDDPSPASAAGRRIARLMCDARVVALGEPAHGVHQPLALRNRLLRFLVERCGFTAIALETGLGESRLLHDYVLGGPGDAAAVARDGFTWGFGGAPENAALIEWVRRYNLATPRRKVMLYGIDASGGDNRGEFSNAGRALANVLACLAGDEAPAARRAREAAARFVPHFSRTGYAALSGRERAALHRALRDLVAAVRRGKAAGCADRDWALRDAIVVERIAAMLAVWPEDPPGGGLSPRLHTVASMRDRLMADNVQWALGREGPQGKLLLFAHNAHIMNAAIRGGIWDVYEKPPVMMGQHLRERLGDALYVVTTVSSAGGDGFGVPGGRPGSFDAALRRADASDFLLDLRGAKARADILPWLRAEQSIRTNLNTEIILSPYGAFDAVVHFGRLSASGSAGE